MACFTCARPSCSHLWSRFASFRALVRWVGMRLEQPPIWGESLKPPSPWPSMKDGAFEEGEFNRSLSTIVYVCAILTIVSFWLIQLESVLKPFFIALAVYFVLKPGADVCRRTGFHWCCRTSPCSWGSLPSWVQPDSLPRASGYADERHRHGRGIQRQSRRKVELVA